MDTGLRITIADASARVYTSSPQRFMLKIRCLRKCDAGHTSSRNGLRSGTPNSRDRDAHRHLCALSRPAAYFEIAADLPRKFARLVGSDTHTLAAFR